MHSLDIPGLKAYLDNLERFEKFTPDCICIDYPDLFAMDSKNLRLELGRVVAELKGIASERNCAVVTVSQGNRESETATTVRGAMASEDISKLATADVMLTYSQTDLEYLMGLGRVFVEKARQESGKISILITQAYAMGQFVLDSMRMPGEDYWGLIESKKEGGGRTRVPKDENKSSRRRSSNDD